MQTSPYVIPAIVAIALAAGSGTHAGQPAPQGASMTEGHMHGAAVPAVTFAELERTAQQLADARRATEPYRDVRDCASLKSTDALVSGAGKSIGRWCRRDASTPTASSTP